MALASKLTNGETLFITRLRRELTQVQMAAQLRVPVETYRLWETDDSPTSPRLLTGPLKLREGAILCRRRAGMLQKELAKEMGVSRCWIIRMEAGKVSSDRLVEFWRNR